MQNTVLILSGLYGVLRPLDLIQAYRWKWAPKCQAVTQKSLWLLKQSVTEMLNNSIADDEVFVISK